MKEEIKKAGESQELENSGRRGKRVLEEDGGREAEKWLNFYSKTEDESTTQRGKAFKLEDWNIKKKIIIF